jgi:outer membrane autotransporter protein
MRIPLNPIMLGVLAATLPAFSGPALAADFAQVLVNDPAGGTQVTLNPGDTVTHAGTGGAIDVSVAGNAVRGDGIAVNAGSASARITIGVRASAGGSAALTGSTIKTLGDGQGAHGLAAIGAGSLITAAHTDISTQGAYSHGVYAQNGGRIELDGGSVTTSGSGSSGLRAEGANAVITAKDVTVATSLYNAGGAYVDSGGRIAIEGGTITVTGNLAPGVNVNDQNSLVTLRGTVVNAANGAGARVEGGRFEMDGGSITSSGAAIMLSSGSGPASVADIRNATLVSTGDVSYGLNINATNTSAVVDNVSISALGYLGTGVWLPSTGTAFTANRFDITSAHLGIDNRAGVVTLTDGTVKTLGNNAHGLYVSREYGSSATIQATRVDIDTQGDGAVGVLARVGGAAITLEDVNVTTRGATAYGLFASGTGASLSARNTVVNTSGANASGLSMSNRAAVTLDSTRFTLQGAGANGIWSYLTAAGLSNSVVLRNGSQISTQDGVGLLASGGGHTFLVSDSNITTRTGGDIDSGVLLHSRSVTVTSGGVSTVIESEQVNLDASNAVLTGDVLADSGIVDVSLKNGSALTGALVQRGPGRINSLTLDSASAWTVRNDSSLGTLNNAGTVAFAAPAGGTGFKTLTVNNYVGGGTLVLNTQLGDDASPTDKLVIDGGTTSGNTSLRIVNAGGDGGQTQYGIRVVETVNGGTTTPDAFRLDSGSTGYRASAATVSLNGYDYSLVRGGNGGVAPDWYLTSDYTPPTAPPGPTDPTNPTDPDVPAPPVTPPEPVLPGNGFKNVSPESGAWAGNRLASTRLFTHSLHDRVPAYADGDATAATGRGLWARVQGRHDSGLRMSEGRVDVDTDSAMVQLGGDLFKAAVGQDGAAYAGLMGGYGDARSRAVSTLMLPGAHASTHARARGNVSGYAVGVYGTYYANDLTRLGAYADTWLQYGRYRNQISSELGSVRYRSNVWSASLEAGYAIQPFAAGSTLEALVIEPNAQVIYSRYDAKDATLQGTRMRSDADNAWQSRVGVRVYPRTAPQADKPAVRPFLETNWLHNGGNPKVRMGENTLAAQPARNALELKLGAEGRVGKRVQVSGHVFGQAGEHDQRGYGGMLNVSYRW